MNGATAVFLILLILIAALLGVGYLYAECNRYEMIIDQLTQDKLRLEQNLNEVKTNCEQQLSRAQATIEKHWLEQALLAEQVEAVQAQLSQAHDDLGAALAERVRLTQQVAWLQNQMVCSQEVKGVTTETGAPYLSQQQSVELAHPQSLASLQLDSINSIIWALLVLDFAAAAFLIYLLCYPRVIKGRAHSGGQR